MSKLFEEEFQKQFLKIKENIDKIAMKNLQGHQISEKNQIEFDNTLSSAYYDAINQMGKSEEFQHLEKLLKIPCPKSYREIISISREKEIGTREEKFALLLIFILKYLLCFPTRNNHQHSLII